MVVRMLLLRKFPMMPTGQRMAATLSEKEAPGLHCASHLVLWEKMSLKGNSCAALDFPAPHSHSIPSPFYREDGGKGEPQAPGPAQSVLQGIFHSSHGPDCSFSR